MHKLIKPAVVLLSGGLDSSTLLYLAKKKGYKCSCLIFDYGQRHKKEIVSAKRIAKSAGCACQILKIDFPWKGSCLLDKSEKIPVNEMPLKLETAPSTYVPGRNTVFISFALSFAEKVQAPAIFIGANAIDFSGYPDCRPKYFRAWQNLIYSLGLKIKILTPLLNLNKAQIVKLGNKLKVPFALTWSCYKGEKQPCEVCDSCKFRRKGFVDARIADPLLNK